MHGSLQDYKCRKSMQASTANSGKGCDSHALITKTAKRVLEIVVATFLDECESAASASEEEEDRAKDDSDKRIDEEFHLTLSELSTILDSVIRQEWEKSWEEQDLGQRQWMQKSFCEQSKRQNTELTIGSENISFSEMRNLRKEKEAALTSLRDAKLPQRLVTRDVCVNTPLDLGRIKNHGACDENWRDTSSFGRHQDSFYRKGGSSLHSSCRRLPDDASHASDHAKQAPQCRCRKKGRNRNKPATIESATNGSALHYSSSYCASKSASSDSNKSSKKRIDSHKQSADIDLKASGYESPNSASSQYSNKSYKNWTDSHKQSAIVDSKASGYDSPKTFSRQFNPTATRSSKAPFHCPSNNDEDVGPAKTNVTSPSALHDHIKMNKYAARGRSRIVDGMPEQEWDLDLSNYYTKD